jgi:hypothetical protein
LGLLSSLFKKWEDGRICKAVAKTQVRNEALREVLLQYGVNLAASRDVDLHFWALREKTANELAAALRNRGYSIKTCAPGAQKGSPLWNVEATAVLAPTVVLGEEFTNEIVRMASEIGCTYDGWGTSIPEALAQVQKEGEHVE